jgi:BlaI family transcriptional regulator, penicillinase repressor
MAVTLTKRELEIMTVLWDLGSGTVTEVRERMDDDLAYTTVLSFLRTMHEKGYVRHVVEGRAHRFIPRVRRDAVNRNAVSSLVETVFGGSPELALTQLVSDRRLSNAELRRIRDLIDQRLPEEER